MTGILVDNNCDGHFQVLLYTLESESWREIWLGIGCATPTFETLGLSREVPDGVLWQECQRRQLLLLTANRNDEGPESLEAAIRDRNTPECLPVITFADAKRVLESKSYAERVAIRLLDYVLNIENYRGSGRLYVP